MNSIDEAAQKNFIVGILALIISYKVYRFENNIEEATTTTQILDNSFKHVHIIKDNSFVIFLHYTLTRSLNNFVYSDNFDKNDFNNLLRAFKLYKIFRKINKQ
jgi:hypothetical protein